VWNGVPSDFACTDPAARGQVRREFGIPPASPVVISVGRLDSVKGHIYLVEAAARVREAVPNARFLLVGSGPEESRLRRRAAELNMGDGLIFAGLRHDVARLLAAADVAVLPSLYEGFGLAAVEAMAAGMPVVGTRVGGLPEVIVDGETGLLVPPASPEGMAEAVIRLCRDADLRRRLGDAGRERHAQRFTLDRMIREFENIYGECLGGRKRFGQPGT
jgi:glycosyltransferase involved in cell wall biosynthesis